MFHTPAHKNVAHPGAQVSLPHCATTVDFEYVDHGTVIILNPKSQVAKAWAANDSRTLADCGRWGYGYGIQHSSFYAVLDEIDEAGLSI